VGSLAAKESRDAANLQRTRGETECGNQASTVDLKDESKGKATMTELARSSSYVDAAEVDGLLTVQEMRLEAAARRLSISRKPCNCHAGLSVASLVALYLEHHDPKVRAILLTLPITTRRDALEVLRLLDGNEDQELAAHLLGCLRLHLSAA
jgi:hypothetical protein